MLASKSDEHVKMYKFFVRPFSIIKIKAYKNGFQKVGKIPYRAYINFRDNSKGWKPANKVRQKDNIQY